MDLNRKAKGDLAELKVATDLRARGYKIAIPFGEDCDFDLILCRDDGALERVQVKYARSNGHVIEAHARSYSLTKRKGEGHQVLHVRHDRMAGALGCHARSVLLHPGP